MVEKFPVFIIKNYLFRRVQWSLALGQECSNIGLSSPSITLWLYIFFFNLFACLLDA